MILSYMEMSYMEMLYMEIVRVLLPIPISAPPLAIFQSYSG